MDPLSWAFNGGEDYELTGTISPESFDTIESKDGIIVIGRVTGRGQGVYLKNNEKRKVLEIHGYDHFVK
jgi:thiamine-monophosphate kinase